MKIYTQKQIENLYFKVNPTFIWYIKDKKTKKDIRKRMLTTTDFAYFNFRYHLINVWIIIANTWINIFNKKNNV